MKHPDDHINCLLIQPAFPKGSFWNYTATVELIGAKTINTPLGLITVAALLPQHWTFKLVDLNCEPLTEADWEQADLVCVGGMLPQQAGLLTLIREAKKRGKFVAVGGADPSSQPDVYVEADARVLDEGELTIPIWLESWKKGQPAGLFRTAEKPDMTTTPVPRFDLLKIDNYNQFALQISRGCPFNCEFCDIIELFGRKPRIKKPEQVLRELETIRATGYTGGVDIVDDNFIGNKRYIRREILPVLAKWNKERFRPFYFVTEASMNLADDEPMMREMSDAGFRIIFTGIETPDPELLMKAQKTQNTVHPIQERLGKMMKAGLVPTAGFIVGFDGEKKGVDTAIIKCIEDAPIVLAMIGMLVALPNTQLTRRLKKEGRLLGFDGKPITEGSTAIAADVSVTPFEVADQTVAGLNFVTSRDRVDILKEYRNAINTVYQPKAFMDRVLRMTRQVNFPAGRLQRPREFRRNIRGLIRLIRIMHSDKRTRKLFWRNAFFALLRGPNALDLAMQMAAMYVHFDKQRDYILKKTEPFLAEAMEADRKVG